LKEKFLFGLPIKKGSIKTSLKAVNAVLLNEKKGKKLLGNQQ